MNLLQQLVTAVIILAALALVGFALVATSGAADNAHETTVQAQAHSDDLTALISQMSEDNADLTAAILELARSLARDDEPVTPWLAIIVLAIIGGLVAARWRISEMEHRERVSAMLAQCTRDNRRLAEGERWTMEVPQTGVSVRRRDSVRRFRE